MSVTLAVKFEVPAVVGVPVIAPLDVLSDSPAGRLPDEMAHVKGEVPPLRASVWLYAVPTVPFGRLDVVIVSVALTTIESAFDAVAATLSVTFAVKFEVPAVVDVPVIAPVDVLSDRPEGRAPDRIDHVYGVVPPVAWSV